MQSVRCAVYGRQSVARLVIVNADDWGISAPVTDAILGCFEAGSISSMSAMIWMDDSDRAASIGREQGLPAGLHLNLDTAFADPGAPRTVREALERVRPWFAGHHRHVLSYHPSRAFQRCLSTCIQAQLDEFHVRYGREPTHVDGHHHIHLTWNVLTSRALPDGTPIRSTAWPDRNPLPLQVLRSAKGRWLRHRFRTTDLFYDLRDLDSALGGIGLTDIEMTGGMTVEVMAHPGVADELKVLHSESWHRFVAELPLGSFDDLP